MQDSAAAKVKDAYEATWSGVLAAMEAEIALGETELSRLLHRVFDRIAVKRPAGEWQSLIFGRETPAPTLAGHRIARDWIADTVIEHARRIDADAIIETGSGWGYNLFNIWLRGGPQVPYHAFEYTDAGRAACERLLKASRTAPQITTYPFDYRAADLRAIAGRYQRPLIYTSHSIEQIGELPRSCIDAFLALAPSVEVLHFEPVGWQVEPDHWASDRVAEHCRRNGYNENLWPLLEQGEEEGRLVVEETRVNVMAPKLFNASTLVRWRSQVGAVE